MEATRICLVGDIVNEDNLIEGLKGLGMHVVMSIEGWDILTGNGPHDKRTCFVLKDFKGSLYRQLIVNKNAAVWGYPVLRHAIENKSFRPIISQRPLFNFTLSNAVVSFSGIGNKQDVSEMARMVFAMAGTVRREMDPSVTHLVCLRSEGQKYEYAKTFDLKVVRPLWILDAWAARHDENFVAADTEFTERYLLKVFQGHKTAFYGFSEDRKEELLAALKSNGGEAVELGHNTCTRIIVSEDGSALKTVQSAIEAVTVAMLSVGSMDGNVERKSSEMDCESMDAMESMATAVSSTGKKCKRNDSIRRCFSRSLSFIREHTPIGSKSSSETVKRSHGDKENQSQTLKRSATSADGFFKAPALQSVRRNLFGSAIPKETIESKKKDSASSKSSNTARNPKRSEEPDRLKPPSQSSSRDKPQSICDLAKEKLSVDGDGNTVLILKSSWFWKNIQCGFAFEKDLIVHEMKRAQMSLFVKELKARSDDERQVTDVAEPTELDGDEVKAEAENDNHAIDENRCPPGEQFTAMAARRTYQENSKESSLRRYQCFLEIVDTEENYVKALEKIIVLFRDPLAEMVESGTPILRKAQIDEIFGRFVPIHSVHTELLKQLRAMKDTWFEECLIGKAVDDHCKGMTSAYMPFINNFECMTNMLNYYRKRYPFFDKFYKASERKAEYGRQTLQDLMIRPVQRLPSLILLLEAILKNTSSSNPDRKWLELALFNLRFTTSKMNENKRKVDEYGTIFKLCSDIEGCPPKLVSSSRRLSLKTDAVGLTVARGEALTFFIFTDVMEIAKRRGRFPSENSSTTTSAGKRYEHVKFLEWSNIRYLYNIVDSPQAFAIEYCLSNERTAGSSSRELYAFKLITLQSSDFLAKLDCLISEYRRHPLAQIVRDAHAAALKIDTTIPNANIFTRTMKIVQKQLPAIAANKSPRKINPVKRKVGDTSAPMESSVVGQSTGSNISVENYWTGQISSKMVNEDHNEPFNKKIKAVEDSIENSKDVVE